MQHEALGPGVRYGEPIAVTIPAALPPDLGWVLGDRELRLKRIGDAALFDLRKVRDACEEQSASWVMQQRINACYRSQRR